MLICFKGIGRLTIGSELKGKMLGVIGLGKLELEVAKSRKSFWNGSLLTEENLNLSHANQLEVLPMSKEDLLKNSDIISIHLVLGDRYKKFNYKKRD